MQNNLKKLHSYHIGKGFTLTEVMVSLFILTIIWISAVGTVIVSKYAASHARHKTQAIYVAQRTLEQIRRQPFQSPNFESYAASLTGPVNIDTMGNFSNPINPFMGNQIVTVKSLDTYRKRVQVEVNWTEHILSGNVVMREYCTTDIANEPQLN